MAKKIFLIYRCRMCGVSFYSSRPVKAKQARTAMNSCGQRNGNPLHTTAHVCGSIADLVGLGYTKD